MTRKIRRIERVTLALLTLAIATPGAVRAQHMDHKHSMMQQNMSQVLGMMQYMDQVVQKAHHLNQEMANQMKDSQGHVADHYRRMQRIGESMEAMAEDMKVAMRESDLIIEEQNFTEDREMYRDIIHLRDNMMAMAERMEKTLDITDRMARQLDSERIEE